MPERGFLNNNDFISFPLIDQKDRSFSGGGELSRRGITDAGFIMGLDAGFIAGDHEVHLYSVIRAAAVLRFDFRSDAPGMSGYRFLFEIADSDPKYCTIRTEAEMISGGIPAPDRGEAYLVTGDLSALRALSVATHLLTTPIPVEAALIQTLTNTFVRGVSIANDARRCPEPNCGSSLSSHSSLSTDDSFPFVFNLVGDLKLKEGNNLSITVSEAANSLTLNARRGLGQGKPCEDVIIDEDGFRRGDDCVSCDGFIKSLNGVAIGKALRLKTGPGVAVVTKPAENKIEITVEVNKVCEN